MHRKLFASPLLVPLVFNLTCKKNLRQELIYSLLSLAYRYIGIYVSGWIFELYLVAQSARIFGRWEHSSNPLGLKSRNNLLVTRKVRCAVIDFKLCNSHARLRNRHRITTMTYWVFSLSQQ